jgi:hypothetical protein
MGDRGQVVVKEGDSEVYFYSHWTGSELPRDVARALVRAKGAGRLDDGPYLARIVFCEMIRGDNFDSTTGFGISSNDMDSEYPNIVIDVGAQTVTRGGKSWPIGGFTEAEVEALEAEADD